MTTEKVAVLSLEAPVGGLHSDTGEEDTFLAHGKLYEKGYRAPLRGQVNLYLLKELSQKDREELEALVPYNFEVDSELVEWFQKAGYEVVEVDTLEDVDKL